MLYNFAVAIDDLDAGITHVVRGEDHLSNTPKQLLVLEAARAVGFGRSEIGGTAEGGGQAPLPVYAHLPLLHGPDGKKLSKRHGAASVQELRDAGYLPEAVRNYLALLGWGAGDDQTVLSTEELIERFTLQRVSRNPARFDETKLRWLNGVWIRELPVEDLTRRVAGRLAQSGHADAAEDQRLASCRGDQPGEDPHARGLLAAGRRAARRRSRGRSRRRASAGWTRRGARRCATCARRWPSSTASTEPDVTGALEAVLARRQVKPREVYQPLRVAIAGTTVSPGIFESVALLGREETLRRIDRAWQTPEAAILSTIRPGLPIKPRQMAIDGDQR